MFSQWPSHQYKTLVEVLFALKIGEYASRQNDYQKTKFQTYIKEADSFYQRNIASLERSRYLDFKIASFHSCRPSEFFAQAPSDSYCLLNLLPVLLEKSKPFRFVESLFSNGTDDSKTKTKSTAQDYTSTFCEREFTVISDKPHEEWSGRLIGKSKKSQGNKSVLLYSNWPNSPVIFNAGKPVRKSFQSPKIIPHDFILPENANLSVVKCKIDLVNHYKQLFMSSRVDYSRAGDLGIAFLAGDAIFGFASFFQRMRTMNADRYIFMNSDFVVPSKTPRLSKLLLDLLCSKEVRQIVARQYLFSYPSLQTTVFTDKPVSMKYRGVFQKSGENSEGKLTYIADFTNESLQERHQRWKARTKIK